MSSRSWLAGLLAIAGAAFAVYASALDAPFFYDDYQNIVDNPHVHWTGLRADALLPTAFQGPTRRPVAYLSFALNYWAGGPDARGYRLVNVVLHALNAVLVALLARATLARLPRVPPPREALWMALLAGLLFALHPLQTQSVTYVVQRMTSLAALFYLSALLAWIRGRESADRRRRALWWTAAALSGLLALGSKEIAITLPVALWLYEWLFFRGGEPSFARRSLLRAGLPLLVVGAGVYLAVFQGSGYAGRDFTAGERLLTELRVTFFYAGLVLWPLPSRLNLLHDFPLSHSLLDPPTTLLSALALLGLIVCVFAGSRRAPLASFGIAWFLLQLALESFALPLALVYEHRMYLPMVGVALAAPWLLFAATGMRASRAVPVGLAVVAALGVGTRARNELWRDELGFWSDVARKSPGIAAARNNRGLALQRARRPEAAIAEYRAAILLDPDDAEAYSNLGSELVETGQLDEAIAVLRRALEIDPDHYRAHHNLGRALVLSGRLEEGAEHVETSARLAPWDPSVWNGLGALRVMQGRLPEAAEAFEQALRLDPAHADARRNLAVVRERLANE